jgi:hypothetical protein
MCVKHLYTIILQMTHTTKPIFTLVKFGIVISMSTSFTIGLILNNELLAGISGTTLIGYLLYHKMNKMYIEYKAYKNLPQQMKNILSQIDSDIDTTSYPETSNEKLNGFYQ